MAAELDSTPRLVVVVGETASGKSALGMELARKFNGEIICADAMTVYKGFDIGTAKPSKDDRAEVPHHMLDIVDAASGFSVAAFKRRAEEAIADVAARGRLPIMVGGSGLYIDSVLYDFQFVSSANSDERDVLNTMSLSELLSVARMRGLDTCRIDAANPRRVIRLIETNGATPERSTIREHTCLIGLQIDRAALASRVKKRIDDMLSDGLQAEVTRLHDRASWDTAAMNSVGYREWREYLDGTSTVEETRDRIAQSTMQLARKQRTWFKRNNSVQWVADPSQAVDIVTTFLNN